MKKVIMFVLVMMLVLSFCAVGLASDKVEEEGTVSSVEEAKEKESIFSTEKAVYDFRKLESKSFVPIRIDGTTTKGDNNWYAKSDFHNITLGSYYTLSSSKSVKNGSYWSIDKIAVTSKLYKDGALKDSESDTSYNASYVGASPHAELTTLWNVSLRGYHTFEESGYVNWYPETLDSTS